MKDYRPELKDLLEKAAAQALRIQPPQTMIESHESTEYDKQMDAFLRERSTGYFAHASYVSEENKNPCEWEKPILFGDSLDGTKGFMLGNDDWCIILGYFDERPIAGGIIRPSTDELWIGQVDLGATYISQGNETSIELSTGEKPAVFDLKAESSLTQQYAQFSDGNHVPESIGLGIAKAHERPYICLSPVAKLWEFIPGKALVDSYGGSILDLAGKPIDYREEKSYRRESHAVPQGFMAGAASQLESIVRSVND